MAKEKKPPHEIIVQKILKDDDATKAVRDISDDKIHPAAKAFFDIAFSVRVKVLLEVFKEMIIPDKELEKMVDALKLDFLDDEERSRAIQEFIEKLRGKYN